MVRRFSGTVVSEKMDKTVVVAVSRAKQHPLYRKRYHTTKKFLAHDPDNSYHVGDMVQISETRPLSRRKRWQVEKMITKNEEAQS